jgi:hypothetical protein
MIVDFIATTGLCISRVQVCVRVLKYRQNVVKRPRPEPRYTLGSLWDEEFKCFGTEILRWEKEMLAISIFHETLCLCTFPFHRFALLNRLHI